ncbi:DUF1822 family protein [Oscillatoria laete-virens NRMC-F 0139]|nr:DUF1822 family protein [Oscillatoria laete-virens]MDL5052073.1 DUF1822 family protein [Oscillatoria laete-virens NRMC-F 0139]
MTNPLSQSLTFTVPLGFEAHELAQQFRRQQTSTLKAKQVYLNTLAVYAVKFYLECLGIETDWESCDSRNPLMQSLMDVADLKIVNCGKIECRPVLPDTDRILVSAEVWSERWGFMAVQLNRSLTEATILGFVERVESEVVALKKLRSLDFFLDYLHQADQPEPVKLTQWLSDAVESGWRTLEELLQPQQTGFAFRYRCKKSATRGKLLNLEKGNEQIILLLEVQPEDSKEIKISVEIYPGNGHPYLPSNLQLMVLDAEGKAVMEAQARNSNKNIQFEFNGEVGEQFSVKVMLDDVSVSQAFII